MKINKNKKGFTIVELVIVVAVIGILAAVLIPTFINLTNKANKAADDSLVKNLNTALAMQEQLPEDPKNVNFHEAVIDLDNYGYKITNLITKSDEALLWNSKTNRFLLEENINKEENKDKKYEFWKISNSIDNSGYSIYAGNDFNEETAIEITNGVGFDVGYKNFPSVSYTRGTTDDGHDVVIRTNSAITNLTIDDASEGTIYHYGVAGALNIIQCHTASYHENGKVAYAEIAKGRIVLENGSKIEEIHVNKKENEQAFDTVIIANNAGANELPDRITRDAVTVSEETLVVKVESNGSSENVYVYADGVTGTKGSTQKITEGENKQNENVNSALGQLVLDNGASSDKAQTTEEKQAAKEEAVEEAIVEEIETDDKYVARIGTKPFESLKDAIAGASANDVIEMTANDISTETLNADKHITIRMNEKTFGGTIAITAASNVPVVVIGTANIDAVCRIGSNYFSNLTTQYSGYNVVLMKDITLTNINVGPNSNFTYDLNGHTITLTKSDSSQGAIYLQNNYQGYAGARLTVKNGNLNFTGTGSSSVGIFAYGELNLSNVNITSTCEYAIETQPDAYCGKGIVNINGGSITTAKTAINATAANDKHPTVSLNGVEIIETGSKKPLLAYGAVMEITDCVVRTSSSEPVLQVGHSAIGGSPSQVTINSGTFDGSITKEEGHFLFIKGGNFKSNPTALVNTSVYDINLNDGYYVVSLNEANVVCSIDGIYYSSIEQAILDRPNDGKTIMLLKNSSEEIVVQQMANFQIDENGHSFTGSISAGEGYNMTVMNGHYMITPPPQARIGSNDYLTLGEAIKAILKGQEASGASITLLSDTDVETVQISKPSGAKTFTIVTNGFAINTTLKAPSGWTYIYIIENGSYHSISNGSTFSLASLGDVEVRIQ